MNELKQGTCKFCGQTMQVNVKENATEEEIDEEASNKCGCSEAQEAREAKENAGKALKNIEKISLDCGYGVKCIVSQTSKGKIKVKKQKTEVEVREE